MVNSLAPTIVTVTRTDCPGEMVADSVIELSPVVPVAGDGVMGELVATLVRVT
jgi:diacylglycerol kinase family enzyme